MIYAGAFKCMIIDIIIVTCFEFMSLECIFISPNASRSNPLLEYYIMASFKTYTMFFTVR